MSFSKNVIQKPVKEYEPYCTICQQFLKGNGSFSMPYECKCGVYRFDGNKYALVKIVSITSEIEEAE